MPCRYTLKAAFIEIYNENVFDLLRLPGAAKEDLPIKQDQKGKTFIQGVNRMEIDPTDLQVFQWGRSPFRRALLCNLSDIKKNTNTTGK